MQPTWDSIRKNSENRWVQHLRLYGDFFWDVPLKLYSVTQAWSLEGTMLVG